MTQPIKFHIEAFREIRLLPATDADAGRRARAVAAAAGDGYEAVRTENPRNRARWAVLTRTRRAMLDNARDNTLLRSLQAGR